MSPPRRPSRGPALRRPLASEGRPGPGSAPRGAPVPAPVPGGAPGDAPGRLFLEPRTSLFAFPMTSAAPLSQARPRAPLPSPTRRRCLPDRVGDGGRDARWSGRSRSAGPAGVPGEVAVSERRPEGLPVRGAASRVPRPARPSVRAVGRGRGRGPRAVSALAGPWAAASGSRACQPRPRHLRENTAFYEPKAALPLIPKPTCAHGGNLIGVFLIPSHLTHQNAIWRERERRRTPLGSACRGPAPGRHTRPGGRGPGGLRACAPGTARG